MTFNLGDKEPKGAVFLLLAVWQSLQPCGESFPLPTALEKCPRHGASGSLRSPVLNPTALQEPWGSTAPLQVGSTHLKRYHSNLQNLPEDLRRRGTHSGPKGAAPLPVPQGHPSACPHACGSCQPLPAAQDLSLQCLFAVSTSSDSLKWSEIYIRRL